MSDSASLQNLNDIVVPDPVAWWPPAPGWYLLAVIVLAVVAWLAVRQWRRWQHNAYRRQALAALSSIREEGSAERLREVPELLKRTALSVWPRESVAALSGVAWHRFLDESANITLFCGDAGKTLDQLSYAGRDNIPLASTDKAPVLDAAECWLKQHHRQAQSR